MEKTDLVFGHRRLAIIDLSETGIQPMSNESGSLWITYNGEIYNYLELREELIHNGYRFLSQSDTEVVLYAYQEWGTNCVNHFNGMWSFSIADFKERILFCSRDRMGIKHFYYFIDQYHFVFTSEIKQLLEFPFILKKINESAVYGYLAYEAVEQSEETFFIGINRLLQGQNLVFNLDTHILAKQYYYQPIIQLNQSITSNEAAEEFRRLLTDSVKLHLRSDVEVGSCLSGGLDSSSIVCLMQRRLQEQGQIGIQHTFSSHFEEKEANELEYIEEVIRFTHVQAHLTNPTPEEFIHDLERLVWHQDEPFGSTSIFAQWSVFKLVHGYGIKVMLDGQGADEMLAGYIGLAHSYFKELLATRRLFRFIVEVFSYKRLHGMPWSTIFPGLSSIWTNITGKIPGLFNAKTQVGILSAADLMQPSIARKYQDQSHFISDQQLKPFGNHDHLQNLLYQLTFHGNLQSLLKYEDRNSMAFSVEARVPFLDYRLVEFIFSLPSEFKIKEGYTKRVLRNGMENIIPEKIRWRVGKLGFATPEALWQRSILKPMIEKALLTENVGYFIKCKQALTYLKHLEKHQIMDFTPWRWLNLSLWMKVYDLT
jgi:asparagine synthase (glutamine-hydrolysing)